MAHKIKIKWREGETIVETVKPSPLKFFWHYFLAVFILFTLSFFSFWLLRQGLYGSVIIATCLIASFALFLDARRRRNENYWVLTNERLIDVERHGLFSETVSPIEYSDIADVHIRRRGINARLFGLGDLVTDTANEDYAISLSCVRHPQIVLEWIMQLSQSRYSKLDFSDSRIVLKHFYKLIPRLSVTDISEIKNRLDNRAGMDDNNF